MASSWSTISPRIKSRIVTVNDLSAHILEAYPTRSSPSPFPLIVLLHGFPELAYSWRKVMVPLADAGYHVIAPDSRGYGRTTSISSGNAPIQFSDDISPYRPLNLATDVISLVYTLGYNTVAAVVGHDAGSPIAGLCALARPDLFRSVVMMSSQLPSPPPPSNSISPTKSFAQATKEALALLDPPRKHYTMYYSTPEANADLHHPSQGLHDFIRAYYHAKSADCDTNQPYRLPSSSPADLAVIPHYYIMPLHESMPETVAHIAPSKAEVESRGSRWLPEEELQVYVEEYERTGFQGGLNRYRCLTDPKWTEDLRVFYGKRVAVPAMFIAGKKDWGVYQYPGMVETMKSKTCERLSDENFVLIEGAGHWVQQEQPAKVVSELLRFLGEPK